MLFLNRQEAGEKLAKALMVYKNSKDAIILALPRGGVIVAYEVAKKLNLPLDIVVPRKIGAPGNPEYAIGAITETGEGVWNKEEKKHLNKKWLAQEIEKEKKEAERRLKIYRQNRPPISLKNKTVILVDDGVATGLTMRAAVQSVKKQGANKIILAIPHGAPDSINLLRQEVDDIVCLEIPSWYPAVGAFYQSFPQNTDEEVIELMRKAQNFGKT